MPSSGSLLRVFGIYARLLLKSDGWLMYVMFGVVIYRELLSEVAQREQRVIFRWLLFFDRGLYQVVVVPLKRVISGGCCSCIDGYIRWWLFLYRGLYQVVVVPL
jgi:hypothetical protein